MVKIPTPKPFGKPKLPIPGLPLQKIGDRINNAADVIKERLENSPLGNLNTPQKDTSELGRLIEAASGSRLSSAPGFRQLRTYLDNEVERDGGESLTKSLRKRLRMLAVRQPGQYYLAKNFHAGCNRKAGL